MAQTCSAKISSRHGFSSHNCGNRAKVKRGDRWYCGIHDPDRAPTKSTLVARARWALTGANSTVHNLRYDKLAEWALANLPASHELRKEYVTALAERERAELALRKLTRA